MHDLTLNNTLLAKAFFKWHANEGGVTIYSYRADNGRFADSGFQQAVKDCNQKTTYCAVGAHYQNRIVERRIKELTLISRMLLLHAKRHWPDYVTTMMWPFALKEAAYRLNRLSLWSDGRSCEATFFDVDTIGSPCFVLDSCLQLGVGSAPRWEPRSHLGIYVSHSPSHAGSVALILNPQTGHVSPQFHVVFDDHFTRFHLWRKMSFHLMGLSWLRTPVRKSRRNIMSSPKHCFFQMPNQETFLCLQNDVSNNSNGTHIDRETINHNVSQNLLSTEPQTPIHVGLSDYSEARGIS